MAAASSREYTAHKLPFRQVLTVPRSSGGTEDPSAGPRRPRLQGECALGGAQQRRSEGAGHGCVLQIRPHLWALVARLAFDQVVVLATAGQLRYCQVAFTEPKGGLAPIVDTNQDVRGRNECPCIGGRESEHLSRRAHPRAAAGEENAGVEEQPQRRLRRSRSASSSVIQPATCSLENLRGSGRRAPSARSRAARKSTNSCFCSAGSAAAAFSISAGCGSHAGHFGPNQVEQAAVPAPDGEEAACRRGSSRYRTS